MKKICIVLALFALGCNAQEAAPLSTDVLGSQIDEELELQVLLEDTIALRVEFARKLDERYGEFEKEALAYENPDEAPPELSFRDYYEESIGVIGANGIIETVHALYPGCHGIGHDLGKVIYTKLGSIGGGLRTCEDACSSGCMHGVLMEAFSGDGEESHSHELGVADNHSHVTVEDVAAQIDTICADENMNEMYKPGDCAHGVGHAMMYISNYEIAGALEYCALFETRPMVYYCATGAYMEYVGVYDMRDYQAESIFYPCDEYAYSAACFRYKMVHVLRRSRLAEKSLDGLVEGCMELDGEVRLGCFHGFGNAHLGLLVDGKMGIGEVCDNGNEEDEYVCIDGVIERMAKYHPEVAQETCAELKGWQRDLCFEGAERGMYSLEKSFEFYY